MSTKILIGNCQTELLLLAKSSINCVVTSPPYFIQRDYGDPNQIGIEETAQEYIDKLVSVFDQIHSILTEDGTVWLNLGDSYVGSAKGRMNDGMVWTGIHTKGNKQSTNKGSIIGKINIPKNTEGLKPKDLYGIPWRVAFALQERGWYLRKEIIWHKPNPMVESMKDRPTSSHEHIFLLTKSKHYFYDKEAFYEPIAPMQMLSDIQGMIHNCLSDKDCIKAIREIFKKTSTVNLRSVWNIVPQSFKGAHFATFPKAIPERCIQLGCPKHGTVLDPFAGSGTTGVVANNLGRDAVLIELNPDYVEIIKKRIQNETFIAGYAPNIEIISNSVGQLANQGDLEILGNLNSN